MTPDLQAKVAEIRQRAQSHRAMDRMDRTMYASGVIDAMLDDIDTLLAALDAERAAVVAWLRKQANDSMRKAESLIGKSYVEHRTAGVTQHNDADAIERGEHRE